MNLFSIRHRPTWTLRITALLILPVQFIMSNQMVYAEIASEVKASTAVTPHPFKPPTQKVPAVIIPPPLPPDQPPVKISRTATQICASHLFPEPLLPSTTKTNPKEDSDLLAALKTYKAHPNHQGLAGLEAFAQTYPNSPWIGSILLNLGIYYRHHGYYTRALAAWEAGWAATKSCSVPYMRSIADRTVGELLTLLGSLGRLERLEPLLKEVNGRPLTGGLAQESVRAAHESHWQMVNQPGDSYKCGPYALESICHENGSPSSSLKVLEDSKSIPRGFSLYQVQQLSDQVGFHYQSVRRVAGASVITPAVIHWKSGHYAAVLKPVPGGYLVKDPTFGPTPALISQEAIDDESDGFFLVPSKPLPSGWSKASDAEARSVFGRGVVNNGIATATTAVDLRINCAFLEALHALGIGMPSYNVIASVLSLTITDTPVGYSPPVGPSVAFTVNLTQFEASQTGNFSYFNQGPLAVNNWTSFVSGTFGTGNSLTVNTMGGGQEIYSTYNTTTATGYQGYYSANLQSQATLWVSNTDPVTKLTQFERRLPNGSKQVYSMVNGVNTFMTAVIDPQGNQATLQYSTVPSGLFVGDLLLNSITDAVGQITTFSYGLSTKGDPLKITSITDPTTRTASFGYSGSPLVLSSLTDEYGLTSSISYNLQNMITAMNTPYGTTSFIQGSSNEQVRTIQVTNPIGQQEFYMRRLDGYGYFDSLQSSSDYPVAPSPPAKGTGSQYNYYNGNLEFRNTYYWNRHEIDVMHGSPINLPFTTDLTSFFLADFNNAGVGVAAATSSYCHIYHWLHQDLSSMSPILEGEKEPLESRIWYNYPGQTANWGSIEFVGSSAQPILISRVLDNGQTESTQFSYNPIGNVAESVDPLGRITISQYDPTGIDLTSVSQTSNDSTTVNLLETFHYNPSFPAHCPDYALDVSGQKTSYTYNTQGQMTSVTNAKGETTSMAYGTLSGATTGNYQNYMLSVTGPIVGSSPAPKTAFQYDAAGRVFRITDPQGHTVQTTYDTLDRPLITTRTDGATQTNTYNRLDLYSQQDWNNKTTYFLYNPIEQLTSEFDPNGAPTSYSWCTCGGLGSLTDPNGHTTSWQRDLLGRVTGKTYPDGGQFTYMYGNQSGWLLSATDPNGTVTTTSYNDDNTIYQTTYTNATGIAPTPTETYAYDSVFPRLSSVTTTAPANAGTTPMSLGTTSVVYNGITAGSTTFGQNQVLSVSFTPASGSAYTLAPTLQNVTYDALGRVLTSNIGAANANSTTASFDALGRVPSVANLLGSTSISYLSNTSRVTSTTLPNGVTTALTYADYSVASNKFTPTVQPLLTSIVNATSSHANISTFGYQYDADNRITQWSQTLDAATTATNWNYQYDPIGQLLNAVKSTGSTIQSQYSYVYDLAGNRTSAQVTTGTSNSVTSTAFDNANKEGKQTAGGSLLWQGSSNNPLYSVTLNGQPGQLDSTQTNFSADVPVTTGSNNVTIIAEDNKANFSTNSYSVSGVVGNTESAPVYNSNGDTTTDAAGNTYMYDAKGELVQETYKAGGNTQYTYCMGNRVGITESTGSIKQFIYSGSGIAEEYDGTNITQPAKRFFGEGFIQYSGSTGTNYFYTRDHLGSVRELTSSTGVLVTRMDYDPYGVTSIVSQDASKTTPDFAYTGMYQHLPSGTYLSATRLYSPNLGRWLTRDPIQESGGLNMYAYCGNNPINATDLAGLDSVAEAFRQAIQIYGQQIKSYENFVSGAIDTVSFGYTRYAREITGVGGVDECSDAYNAGGWAGFALQLGTGGAALLEEGVSKALAEVFGNCFVAGTHVATEKGEKPIESIHVGDRVLSADTNAQKSDTKVDSKTWKQVTLKIDCGPEQVQMVWLRPSDWVTQNHAKVGSKIWYDDPEMQLRGWATVADISSAPTVQPGVGRVVTATIKHFHTNVYRLSLSNGAPIEVTGTHPIYSVTRHDFIHASDLKVGEQLGVRDSKINLTVTNLQAEPDRVDVYNLEVESDHHYFVGSQRILVHNACNSKILGDNLENSGVFRPSETAAHHIVAANDPRAAAARAVLNREGIGINDAENGVFLPRFRSSSNPSGSQVHSTVHTDAYYNQVNNDVINAAPGTVPDVLSDIADRLQKGTY